MNNTTHRFDQKMRCTIDSFEVTGRRDEIEQTLGQHLIEAHNITDSLAMARSIERVW